MDQLLPIDSVGLTKLLNTPAVIRIVSILDKTSLSILELFEYDISIGDIIYSLGNGVITYDNAAIIASSEHDVFEIVPNANLYYAFVRRKVQLTRLGLHILESIQGNQFSRAGEDYPNYPPDTDPRHPSTV